MKICFFNDIGILGGGELWVLSACRGFARMGHQVAVVCPWRSPLFNRCQAEGIEVFGTFAMEGLPTYEPLYHFLRRGQIDVVYCTVIGQSNEAVTLETIVNRINEDRGDRKMALVLKTGLPPMQGMSREHYGIGAGPAVARLHVVSEPTREAFLAWAPDANPGFIEVVHEGTDLSRFNGNGNATAGGNGNGNGRGNERRRPAAGTAESKDASGREPNDPEHPIITCLSRLHPIKGQDNLLLALPSVLEKHPGAHVLIAGSGDDRQRLEQLRDHLELQSSVAFLGHVEDVPGLLRSTDVLVHPSLADGMPNSVVEAMAMGVPVVASEIGGIPELVHDDETGLLVEPHDIGAISGALNRMLDDASLRSRLAAKGSVLVRERFDLERNLKHLARRFEAELETVADAYAARRQAAAPRSPDPVPILFLMNTLRTGGEEAELAILARHLDRARFGMRVLSLIAVDEPAPAAAKIAAAGVPIDTACHAIADNDKKIDYIVDKIRRERIRLVVACQDTRWAYAAFHRLSPAECRLVEHGGIVDETTAVAKDRTDRYIGVSPQIAAAAAARMDEPDRAVCIPSMVDMDEFARLDRDELRRAYDLPQEACVVIFVGRLDPKKRVEDLMQAAAHLLPEYPEVRFLVVGGPDGFRRDYSRRLAESCAALVATGRVIFCGARDDVPTLLAASDILVLPAIGEGMSHVINEAGAARLAVVATADGAAQEQLANGEAGRIVPPMAPEALAETLRELIDDPELRRRLGERLGDKVEAEYSAAVLVPRWEALLQEVADELPEPHQMYVRSRDVPLDFPAEIQIQTTTFCNASCVMCPYPQVSQEFPFGRIDEELYDKILDECADQPGLRRIEPFLMNEPFTDNRMVEFIRRTKRRLPQTMVTVTTNGTPLIPKVTDRLIESGLDAVWFSFNGLTPQTYEKIMGVPYDRVKANIDYLLEVKPASLQVFVNMIETEPMAPEIEENIRYWQSRGVQAGSSQLVNRAGNVENFDELDYMPISEKPVRTCELPFYKMYILHTGEAVLCCMDWRRNVVLGSVREQSIREIWNSDEYRRIRRLHIEGRDAEIGLCGDCSYTLR